MSIQFVSKDNELKAAVECNDLAAVKKSLENHSLTISESASLHSMKRAIELGHTSIVKELLPVDGWLCYDICDVLKFVKTVELAKLLGEKLLETSCRWDITLAMVRCGLTVEVNDIFLAEKVVFLTGGSEKLSLTDHKLPTLDGFKLALLRGIFYNDNVNKLKSYKQDFFPEMLIRTEHLIERDAIGCFKFVDENIIKKDRRQLIRVYSDAYNQAIGFGSDKIYTYLKTKGLMLPDTLEWSTLLPKLIEVNAVQLVGDMIDKFNISRDVFKSFSKSMSREMEAMLAKKFIGSI